MEESKQDQQQLVSGCRCDVYVRWPSTPTTHRTCGGILRSDRIRHHFQYSTGVTVNHILAVLSLCGGNLLTAVKKKRSVAMMQSTLQSESLILKKIFR